MRFRQRNSARVIVSHLMHCICTYNLCVRTRIIHMLFGWHILTNTHIDTICLFDCWSSVYVFQILKYNQTPNTIQDNNIGFVFLFAADHRTFLLFFLTTVYNTRIFKTLCFDHIIVIAVRCEYFGNIRFNVHGRQFLWQIRETCRSNFGSESCSNRKAQLISTAAGWKQSIYKRKPQKRLYTCERARPSRSPGLRWRNLC